MADPAQIDDPLATINSLSIDVEGDSTTAPEPPIEPPIDGGGGTFGEVQYTVVITDIYGKKLEEVPAKNLQYTYSLNDAGSVSFSLPLYHPKTTYDLLTPGARNVLVYRNDTLVWGGRLWSASSDAESAVMQFSGNGWFSLLLKRFVTSTLTYKSIDQFQIAWNLIDFTQGKDYGDLNIRRASVTPSGVARSRTYLGYERKNIGEALQGLAAVRNGFDFEVTPDLLWRTYYPYKGSSIDQTFELGKNIRGYSIQYDANGIENAMTGIGSGDGKATLISTQTDLTSEGLYGLMQGVRSWKDVKRQDTLDSHTEEELRLTKDIMTRPEISVVTDDPPFGSYNIGDTVRVKIEDGYNQLNAAFRITTMTIAIADAGREAIGLFFEDQVES